MKGKHIICRHYTEGEAIIVKDILESKGVPYEHRVLKSPSSKYLNQSFQYPNINGINSYISMTLWNQLTRP